MFYCCCEGGGGSLFSGREWVGNKGSCSVCFATIVLFLIFLIFNGIKHVWYGLRYGRKEESLRKDEVKAK